MMYCKNITGLAVFFMFSLVAFHAQRVNAENVPDLEVKMGKVEAIQSGILKQERSLFVRLPAEYPQQNKSYPVLYLLDANDFFQGNVYQQAINLVSRLEAIHDIPEMIVVGIQSDRWYRDVITDNALFEQYVSREVPRYIDGKYRTLPNSILMGHSYAGAFVSGAMPLEEKSFDLFLSLSPVYPSLSFIESVQQRYSHLKPLSAKLLVIDGDENSMDKLMLKHSASRLAEDTLFFSYRSMNAEGHASVLASGLNLALREHFSDYRSPGSALVGQQIFDVKKIREYYQVKDHKYGSKTDEADIKRAAIKIAQQYTSKKKLELALPLWRYVEYRFKEYHMGGFAERFINLGEAELAILLWTEMAELFPDSDTDYKEMVSQFRNLDTVSELPD